VDDADAAVLARAGERTLAAAEALDLPLQPVHGDAHLGNVLVTRAGQLWSDFEDTFLGPVGWDLACLVGFAREFDGDRESSEAALDAYGADIEPAALDVLVELRAVQIVVWTVAIAARFPPLHDRAGGVLAWARERYGH
jgi:Ser/Thr protein kinase RdoA (MazF antagonist)